MLRFVGFYTLVIMGILALPVQAQEATPNSRYFEISPHVVTPNTLKSGQTTIKLWGVERVKFSADVLSAKARLYLEELIGAEKIRCEFKGRTENEILALCNNGSVDLGLAMIQQGYALADRSLLQKTKYETPYKDAEINAEMVGYGLWQQKNYVSAGGGSSNTLVILGVIFIICILGVFAALSLIIMRGFQKVIDAQNLNMDIMSRERALRDKEREIVAGMIDSEIKANKSKIEAYLVVYEEMLRTLKDPARTPKYKKVGDIVQSQPALERSVFDGNTDKMDVLGERLSSEVIHFYARIKTTPEYINIEPSMDVEDVIEIVDKSLKSAKRLDEIADRLVQNFKKSGHSSKQY